MPYQHKSSDTIYKGQEVYVKIDADALNKGEIQVIGEPILADTVVKKVNRIGFEITYLTYFLDLFDKLGGKKYIILRYLLEHKNSENIVIATIRDLANKTNTSTKTVSDTIKLLKEAGLIKCRTGVIMIIPKLAHKGTDRREAYLMQRFEAFDDDQDKNDIDDNQILF